MRDKKCARSLIILALIGKKPQIPAKFRSCTTASDSTFYEALKELTEKGIIKKESSNKKKADYKISKKKLYSLNDTQNSLKKMFKVLNKEYIDEDKKKSYYKQMISSNKLLELESGRLLLFRFGMFLNFNSDFSDNFLEASEQELIKYDEERLEFKKEIERRNPTIKLPRIRHYHPEMLISMSKLSKAVPILLYEFLVERKKLKKNEHFIFNPTTLNIPPYDFAQEKPSINSKNIKQLISHSEKLTQRVHWMAKAQSIGAIALLNYYADFDNMSKDTYNHFRDVLADFSDFAIKPEKQEVNTS